MTSHTAARPPAAPQIPGPWPYPGLEPHAPIPAHPRQERRPRTSRQRPRTGADPEVKPYQPQLALRGISGHLTRSTHGTMAWYALAPRPWFMRADHERDALMSAIGRVLAALPERWLHWRITWQPYPAAEWARRHDNWAHPLPDVPGGVSWLQHLLAEQERALSAPKAVKQVYIGVEIRRGRGRRGSLGDQLAHSDSSLIRRLADRWVGAELSALDEEIQHIDSVLGSPALAGRPVTADEMLHLLYRSCALGLPPEAVMPAAPHTEWMTEDLAAVDQLAHWSTEPYAPTVVVDGAAGGRRHTRHVLIASLGRMDGELNIPAEELPWMTVPDGLTVPIEWSARMRVLPQAQASRSLNYVTDRVYAQQRHYEFDHGIEAPPALARQIDLASAVQDEHETDHTGLSARCEGWWRLAIPASTEREALETFDVVKQLYHPKIAVERSEAQYRLAREFIPGEPLATTAFRRRMSLRHVAMAVPTATEIIGDDYGSLTFTARASGRVIPWNPWHDMDTRQVSGLTPIIGGLGSGKTFLLGTLAAQAVRALGAYVTLLDPSGPLTRLTELPELRGYARGLSLLDAPSGTLNPYGLVADPDRATYPPGPAGDEAYLHDSDAAQAQRTTLVVSLITQLLPASIRRDGAVQQLLLQAVDRVGTGVDHELGEVLDALRAVGEDGERLASSLGPILSTSGPARLLLGSPPDAWASDSDRLLVLSTRGLSLPREGVDQQDWGLDEQLSLPLMHLAAWLAYRRVYELPKAAPKMVGLDELRWLSMTSTGRTLITQFARDNRKYRARVLVAGQLASDVLKLGGDESGLASLCHDVFVGRTTDEQAQQDALRLLRVPIGQGYEPRLGELSSGLDLVGGGLAADAPREFVWRSGAHCEEVRLDLTGPHYRALVAALDTNAARLEDHQ